MPERNEKGTTSSDPTVVTELTGAESITHTTRTKIDLAVLFLGLFMCNLASSLEEQMTYTAAPDVLSAYNALWGYVYLSAIPSVIVAALKPAFSKFSDKYGRTSTVTVSAVFTTAAYILLWTASDYWTFFAGQMLQSIGTTAFFVVSSSLIADIIPLIYRGNTQAYLMIPNLFLSFLAPYLASVLLKVNFHWIFGIGGIFWLTSNYVTTFVLARASAQWYAVHNANSPRGLPRVSSDTYSNPLSAAPVVGMIVAGGLMLIFFLIWESRFAAFPIVPMRLLRNPTAFGALIITGAVYMAANRAVYWFNPFVRVTKLVDVAVAWYLQYGYFGGFSLGAIFAGWLMQWSGRYRVICWTGAAGVVLALGLLINMKGQGTSEWELGLVQALAGKSAGATINAASIGLQASLQHRDIAIGVTLKDFFVYFGGTRGVAVGGALWNRILPQTLLARLPNGDRSFLDVSRVVSDITYIATLSPAQLGLVQAAYVETQRYAIVAGLVIMLVGCIPALFMKHVDLKAAKQTAAEIVYNK
ncbi:MFS general substrate transporter [Gonapodya prolifera JEL478]|uniref:MFS general substrate transporter n=1 Tax=Gonapodya prolifera (strain JEL478) TaxID=1344416 RepID=A0A139A1A9_GONPJ|nr:MFS general substrate transporter [Gonapodya prolifera JEL478]|eukprot:KXS10519.1 MFS general substrate transporter [Gonapodya prolifera JEL478]